MMSWISKSYTVASALYGCSRYMYIVYHYPTGTSYKHQTPLLRVESVQFISLQLNHLKSFLCFLRTPCWHFSGRPWCGTGHHAWVATAEAFSPCCSKEWKTQKKQVWNEKSYRKIKECASVPYRFIHFNHPLLADVFNYECLNSMGHSMGCHKCIFHAYIYIYINTSPWHIFFKG